jgi:peptidoglycan hydrolase-like protein with peptidoglycan-binding domain
MTNFKAMTVPQLRQYADDNNISINSASRKQDIIDAIKAVTTSSVKTTTETVIINRVLFASRALMKGDDVAAVHAALAEKGLNVGNEQAEGFYGAKTALAVRTFQASNRLIVNGRVDKFTAAALGLTWGV